jgi:glucan phosphoethanolaminetransferase (alkaline phosphatase superfamily)
MGEIVFWTLIRISILIPIVWISQNYLDFKFWGIVSITAIYLVVIHPVIISYKKFEEKNKEVNENSLCATCRHYDKSAVLCMKYDKHPSMNFVPCDGNDWEPK